MVTAMVILQEIVIRMPNHYCTPQAFQLRLNLRNPATTNLPISGVIVSGRQSINPASNVLDNNLNTRWANPI
jgi:hypothetical protein